MKLFSSLAWQEATLSISREKKFSRKVFFFIKRTENKFWENLENENESKLEDSFGILPDCQATTDSMKKVTKRKFASFLANQMTSMYNQ